MERLDAITSITDSVVILAAFCTGFCPADRYCIRVISFPVQAVVSGYDETTLMVKLKTVNQDIQDEVHQLKGIIESQAEGFVRGSQWIGMGC